MVTVTSPPCWSPGMVMLAGVPEGEEEGWQAGSEGSVKSKWEEGEQHGVTEIWEGRDIIGWEMKKRKRKIISSLCCLKRHYI